MGIVHFDEKMDWLKKQKTKQKKHQKQTKKNHYIFTHLFQIQEQKF